MTEVPTTRRARALESRARLTEHAAEMFGRQGFPPVRMADIGARVGVTARALYRHFPNKQALLFGICLDAQIRYLDALSSGDGDGDGDGGPGAGFDGSVRAFLAVSLEQRDHAMLWQRDGRYLNPEQHAELAAGLREMVARLAALIAALDGGDAAGPEHRMRARALLSVLTSSGQHPLPQPRPETDELLVRIAHAVARPGPAVDAPPTTTVSAVLESRTEQLLSAATRLFAASGYPGVTLEDIAAEVGLLGPSIYHYVDTKADILVRLVERWYEWQALALLRGLNGAGPDPIDRLRAAFAEIGTLTLQFPDLYGVALTERLYLPEAATARIERTQAGLLRTLTSALREARGELNPAAAATVLYAAIAVTGDLARSPRLREDPDLARHVASIRDRILFAGPGGDSE